MTTEDSFQLFPTPSLSPSQISPHVLPGINPASTESLKRVLEDNQKTHHIFFNNKGFHNHIAHRVLAVWALGADKEVIQTSYERDSEYQRPAFESPEPITNENFNDHLGDERFYNAYLKYFTHELEANKNSVGTVLEEQIFSSSRNFGSKSKSGNHPEMLNRLLAGLVHPMIHTGYGYEFAIPGIVAEGLAQAAVHAASSSSLIPPSVFTSDPVPSVSSLSSRIHSFTFGRKLSNETVSRDSTTGIHAFTTVSRIIKDSSIQLEIIKRATEEHSLSMYEATLAESGEKIYKYVQEWASGFDGKDHEVVKKKVEELQWTNALLYAVSGLEEGEDKNLKPSFKADFFRMHLVTSSLFLPSLIAYLSPASQHTLLRSYFAICLVWWVSRGKMPLDIKRFYESTSTTADQLESAPSSAHKNALVSSNPNPNPWLAVVNQAMNHPDDHLPKIQRALGHFSTLYGSRMPGSAEFKDTELEGAEVLDGTFFVRAAILTAERMGRDKGEGESWWD
ncbi:hypothetical protein E1B28_003196 [Marasmius oreades]|uniref:Oxidoreductase AflY n=1 Tax=Marasmius oreades TaxID=181124 RepID=A0A9P7RLF4_9AGAR|nr:uncharacterized protein E1B28_003196 [Marasmius oreades]KAG7085650.1 hypothetical protein E1B28_003196 [Marasmius oreades]